MIEAPQDGVRIEWVLTWFPPDGDRVMTTGDEGKARRRAAHPEVAAWHPILEHRKTTTTIETRMVEL